MPEEFPPPVVFSLQKQALAEAPRWGLPASCQCTVLSISENLTLRLRGDPPQNPDVALRLHRTDYHKPVEIMSELAWIDALRHDGIVKTPAPQPGLEGSVLHAIADSHSPRGYRHAVAFEFIEGQTPTPHGGQTLVPWFRTLGTTTARLHRHARFWTPPPFFQRKVWTVERILGPGAYWGPWQNALGLDDAGASCLAAADRQIRARMAAFGHGPDRFGLIHGDLRLANLLVNNDTLHVIDFDDCGWGWFLFDVAAAISFHELDNAAPHWVAAWIEGYTQTASLSADEHAILPTLVMMRRLQLTAWLASHSEIPLSQDIGHSFTAGTIQMARLYLNPRDSMSLPTPAGQTPNL